ncbi:formyl transferase domain-containing protein [Flammeovirgaceae bacterium 311]|nr:formyl transferase domain-containing protein [Flammeovirgaceae bacterium 311]
MQPATTEAAIEAAAAYFQPQLIIAPFLKKGLPTPLLQKYTVLTIRATAGTDRGPVNYNGVLTENLQNWRITVYQGSLAKEVSSNSTPQNFMVPLKAKSNFYQHHLTRAVVQDILDTVEKIQKKALLANTLQRTGTKVIGRLHSIV